MSIVFGDRVETAIRFTLFRLRWRVDYFRIADCVISYLVRIDIVCRQVCRRIWFFGHLRRHCARRRWSRVPLSVWLSLRRNLWCRFLHPSRCRFRWGFRVCRVACAQSCGVRERWLTRKIGVCLDCARRNGPDTYPLALMKMEGCAARRAFSLPCSGRRVPRNTQFLAANAD